MGLPLGDLINEGNLGLIAAAKKFDETLGFKFISYAVYWIRQAILLALGEHSRMMRLPMNQVRNISLAQQQMGILEQQLERTATVDELAEAVGIPAGQMAEQLQLDRQPMSLYQPLGQQVGAGELVDLVADTNLMPSDHLLSRDDEQVAVDAMLAVLTARERKILESLYGINRAMESSYGVVAQECNLTSSRIKQIAGGAIQKLKVLAGEKRKING